MSSARCSIETPASAYVAVRLRAPRPEPAVQGRVMALQQMALFGSTPIGAVLMGIWAVRQPDFFQGKTLPRRSDDLVLAPGDGRVPTFGLPDSGRMPELIAPDLSNLPPGQKAVKADEEPKE